MLRRAAVKCWVMLDWKLKASGWLGLEEGSELKDSWRRSGGISAAQHRAWKAWDFGGGGRFPGLPGFAWLRWR